MSECKAYRREIDGAADGGALSTGARAHASACRVCGDELRVRESLRALVGGLGKVEAPADFEFRLRARMAASKAAGGRSHFGGSRWLYGFVPVAVAACFVIVSATLYFRQAARTTPAGAPTAGVEAARQVATVPAPSAGAQGGPAEPAVRGGEVVRVIPAPAASPETPRVMRKPRADSRNAQAREVAARDGRRADEARHTDFFGNEGARVISPPFPVKASGDPLRVILRDERGAERVVPMRGVSFGSQDFLARGASGRPPVAAEVGGVW
jgi:hypothetical protein